MSSNISALSIFLLSLKTYLLLDDITDQSCSEQWFSSTLLKSKSVSTSDAEAAANGVAADKHSMEAEAVRSLLKSSGILNNKANSDSELNNLKDS